MFRVVAVLVTGIEIKGPLLDYPAAVEWITRKNRPFGFGETSRYIEDETGNKTYYQVNSNCCSLHVYENIMETKIKDLLDKIN